MHLVAGSHHTVMNSTASAGIDLSASVDAGWQLSNGFMVFYMQAGFTLYEVGLIRAKNAVDTMSRNLLDFAIGTLGFWLLGHGFAFGTHSHSLDSIIGWGGVLAGEEPSTPDWLFQLCFATNAVTLSSGMLAERSQYWCYFYTSFVICVFVYPLSAHAVWSPQGFLFKGVGGIRFVDFAGGGVVHLIGGTFGFVGCLFCGPRFGRFAPAATEGSDDNNNADNNNAPHDDTDDHDANEGSAGNEAPSSNDPGEQGGEGEDAPDHSEGLWDSFPAGIPSSGSFGPRPTGMPGATPDSLGADEEAATGMVALDLSSPEGDSGEGTAHPQQQLSCGGRLQTTLGCVEIDTVAFKGHNTLQMVAGVFLLWYGWYAFNVGSNISLSKPAHIAAAARTSVSMTLCTSTAVICSALLHRFCSTSQSSAHWDIHKICNALLCALVTVTANCAVIQGWAAIVLGMLACLSYEGACRLLLRLRIDDPVDGFAVHGVGGFLGLLGAGLFAKESYLVDLGYSDHAGLFYGGGLQLLGVQIVGALYLVAIALLGSVLTFGPLSRFGRLRVQLTEEIMGLDLAKHGGYAYPEWQKTQ